MSTAPDYSNEYLDRTDLENRLSEVGMLQMVDKDRNGVIDLEEETRYILPPIQYAGNVVDSYVARQLVPSLVRGSRNSWLKDRATDIAVRQVILNNNGKVPSGLQASYAQTIKWLQELRDGSMVIPGFTYPGPVNSRHINHTPKVGNWGNSAARRARGILRKWGA